MSVFLLKKLCCHECLQLQSLEEFSIFSLKTFLIVVFFFFFLGIVANRGRLDCTHHFINEGFLDLEMRHLFSTVSSSTRSALGI